VDWWHRHGHQRPVSVAFTTTVNEVGVLRAPPGIRAFIAMCASNVLPSSCATGVGHKGAHVGMARYSGPMPGKDSAAEFVLLALPHNAHTGALEAKVESSDSAEKAADKERHKPFRRWTARAHPRLFVSLPLMPHSEGR
jgi:hypothetical protein